MQAFGEPLIHFPVLDSTNLEAWRIIASGHGSHGYCITAAYQTRGKGQGESRWHSNAGQNLCISYIVCQGGIRAADQFLVNICVSLALLDSLPSFLSKVPVKLKWPNDLYAGYRKLGGILIEHSVMGEQISHTVAGVGLNVNQTEFPEELPNPVSLALLGAGPQSLEEIRKRLNHNMDKYFNHLLNGRHSFLKHAYLKSLLGYRQPGSFRSNGILFSGKITGVNQWGHLLVKDDSGKVQRFAHKEIELILQSPEK